MDKFCGSKFWDWNLTWYTETPQFTPCFEETVLVWLPTGILWISSIIALCGGFQTGARDIPWGWLNISKMVGNGILLLVTFLDLSYAFSWHPSYLTMYTVDYSNALIRHMNFVITGGMVVFNKKKGVRTSSFLFLFWFFLVICGFPHYITEIRRALYHPETLRVYPYVSNVIYFPVIFSMFILEMFIDSPPKLLPHPPIKNLPPNTKVSFVNNLLVLWYDSLAIRAYRQPIQLKDLWNLEYKDKLEYLVPLFSKYWNAAADKNREADERHIQKLQKKMNGYHKMIVPYRSFGKIIKPVSVIPILWKCFGWTYITATIFKICVDILMFVNPQILNALIGFEESNEPQWHGFLYAFTLLGFGVIQMILLNTYVFRIFRMGLQMRSTLLAVIYRKALRISNNAKKSFSLGDITNLMSVDAQRFYDVHLYFNMALSAPFTITASLYFLWQLIGWSAFAGLALMLIIIPINGIAAGKIKSLQTEQMRCKDERVKITNEVLTGIKALKMYAWEMSFERKILEIREKEIKMLKYIAYINTSVSFLWTAAPFLVSFVTFSVYTLINPNNVLTAQIAFVSLSLFNIMKLPISLIPRMITNTIQTAVATKRINRFLNSEELNISSVKHEKSERDPLVIEKGSFTWGSIDDKPTLNNINIRVKDGHLVAIVGPVGCGKSSLLSAFLGEMNKLGGYVNTKGSIAYVPQQAWLQNATLRDNILFTKPYKKSLYNKVVEACALLPDFQVLPGGDQTEIGEKGINLSGGQKQRISLARAVYNNAEMYFLDDPLSAVDSHVGKHIFENVVGPKGLLRKKTRLFVTHATTYLPEVDYIIVMKGGCITESGTYPDLMARQGDFSDFIITYSQDDQSTPKDENESSAQKKYERSVSEEVNYSSLANFVSSSTDEDLPTSPAVGERLSEDEQIHEGSIKLSVYKSYVKSGGILLWFTAILCNILYQATTIGANLWLTKWSTDPEIIRNDRHSFKKYYYLGVYGVYGIGQVVSIIVGTLTMYLATTKSSAYLHKNLLRKVLNWPAYMFDVTPLGRVMNRFSYDIDVIDNTFPFTIRQLFNLAGQMVSTLFVICYSSPLFIIVFVPIIVVYFFIEQIFVAVMRQLRRLESISRTPIYSHFSETVSGAHMIRAFGMEQLFISESEQRTYMNQVYTYPSIQGLRWVSLRLDNIGNAIIFFAATFAVLERGTINAGIIGLSVSYALQITGALNWVIRTASDIETNIVAVERINEFDNSPEEVTTSENYRQVPHTWPNKGEIIFDNYKVRYREGLDLVLRGISLTIKGGEKVGIAGRTGAGKSSFTSCLFRIVEAAEGKIVIDGIDIATIELQNLRSRITIIPQDPVLFSGSLRMNLDPFYEYSDQQLWRALELAHLKSFVASLHKGLYHLISENGGNVSIGQRQLICLARAVLRKTKILILDEATAAIDLETDEILQRTIRTEFRNCTVLTIAHKLNTIMDSDRILVLDNGWVKEFDTPQNLLNSRKSIFYGMAKDAGLVS